MLKRFMEVYNVRLYLSLFMSLNPRLSWDHTRGSQKRGESPKKRLAGKVKICRKHTRIKLIKCLEFFFLYTTFAAFAHLALFRMDPPCVDRSQSLALRSPKFI